MKKIFKTLVVVMALVFAVGCGADKDQSRDPKKGDTVATIKTSLGDMEILLFPDVAPKAVENFTTHAENGYYDGLIFHRIIKGFMIQGGDPEGTGLGGESIWGEGFGIEVDGENYKNIRGALAMAMSQLPNSIGSQFYIVQEDAPHLDGGYTVFGQIINDEDLDVLDAISAVETDGNDKPLEDVIIETIEMKIWE